MHKNIEIFDTSYEGYGVGRLESGSIVFVPETVTGDVVNLEIIESKKNFSFAKLINVITPSSMRIDPICPHADVCGGCQFMHIHYPDQLKIKENIIRNAFRKIDDFKIDQTISDTPDHYRLRVKFKLQNGQIGFFAKRSNRFIPVESCLVVKESIVLKAKEFAKKMDHKSVTDFYIIENAAGNSIAHISTALTAKIDPFDGALFGKKASGNSFVEMETPFGSVFSGYTSFFQANRYLADSFQQSIVPYLSSTDTVLELYSGSGFFSVAAASVAKKVTGLDYDGESIRLTKRIQKENLSFMRGDVDKVLANQNIEFNTLIVDPPRAGLSKKIIKYIKEKLPEKVIYISCNPMTMARDIEKVKEEYRLVNYKFFDMFPHTYHIESVAVLERK